MQFTKYYTKGKRTTKQQQSKCLFGYRMAVSVWIVFFCDWQGIVVGCHCPVSGENILLHIFSLGKTKIQNLK